jgi:hypothetical protein
MDLSHKLLADLFPWAGVTLFLSVEWRFLEREVDVRKNN